MFSYFGIPKQLVCDNGQQFVSKHFKRSVCRMKFCTITPPYHPKSNGLAERFFSFSRKGMEVSQDKLDEVLSRALAAYRNTNYHTTGQRNTLPHNRSAASQILSLVLVPYCCFHIQRYMESQTKVCLEFEGGLD